MKLAVISPPQCIHSVMKAQLGYHMALGQELVADEIYERIYTEFSYRGHYIIVDNGAAERADTSFHQIVLAASFVNADEIAMPDVLHDSRGTIKATRAAIHLVPEHKRMFIPQGVDWKDWKHCLKHLSRLGGKSIGVPKLLQGLTGGRVEALKIIYDLQLHNTFDIHLLGCNREPLKEIREILVRYDWVRGIDTGAPIAYAQHDNYISSPIRHSLDWNASCNKDIAEQNIQKMMEICDGA